MLKTFHIRQKLQAGRVWTQVILSHQHRQHLQPCFLKSEQWQGPRAGYHFKQGHEGLGYYLEGYHPPGPDLRSTQAATGQPFLPSPRWQGPRSGYAFKMGASGLGYYQDAGGSS